MPRIARKDLRTNYFHVIAQGINREYIFNSKYLKEKYRELSLKYKEDYGIKILAYCIMDNHVHMLLYCNEINEMSAYMKSVNTSYAKFYNHIKDRVGYVFRNRYEAEPIYNQKYLLNCIGYIHNNPVKASIVKKPENYKYSSYNDYIKKDGIASEEIIKFCFGNSNNYLEQYILIHKNKNKYKDIDNEIDYTNFIEKIKKVNLNEIKKDEIKLKKLLTIAIKEEKIPITKVVKIFEIDRYRIYRLLKK